MNMQVTETREDGLKRDITLLIEAAELDSRLNEKLAEINQSVHLKGFRKGKVPTAHLKRLYGQKVMADIVRDAINESTQKAITDLDVRPAMEPKIEFSQDPEDVQKVMAGEGDLKFSMSFEIIPDFELADFGSLTVVKEVAEPTDEEVENALQRLASENISYKPVERAAEDGDQVTMNYIGRLDGEPFEGGSAEDAKIVLGEQRFIADLEQGLVGMKAGETRIIPATFPADYQAEHLAGKTTEFEVTVTAVEAPAETELNDEFAASLGVETLDKLRELVRADLKRDLDSIVKSKVKKKLFDALNEVHDFDLPPGLVDSELDELIAQEKKTEAEARQIVDDVKRQQGETDQDSEGAEGEGGAAEASAESDDDAADKALRDKKRPLAERRVRVGLVLSEIGRKYELSVSDEEVDRELRGYVGQFRGREQEMYNLIRQNDNLMSQIAIPLYEEKVANFLLELVKVEEKQVTPDELTKVPETADEETA